MKWKFAAIVSTCVSGIVLLVLVVAPLWTGPFGERRLKAETVITEVRNLKELVTVKYSIQRVVGLKEEKVPLGEESILLMLQGDVLAGVDLGEVSQQDVRYSGTRTISITLPAAKLFSVAIDEKQTKVWDRHITWWTPWVPYDPDLEHKARLEGIEDIRKAALSMGIVDQAQRNAETAIRDLLAAFHLQTTFKTRPLD
jgi:hypothetical protein